MAKGRKRKMVMEQGPVAGFPPIKKWRRDGDGSFIGGRIQLDEDALRVSEISSSRRRRAEPRKPIPLDTTPRLAVRSITEVERRILNACKTIRVLPDPSARFQGFRTMQSGVWGNVVQNFMDAYGSEYARSPRFNPTPQDVSDCLTALEWCRYLETSEFNLIWWRSFEVSFSVIAARIGRSDETARRRYSDAMKKVWYASLDKAHS